MKALKAMIPIIAALVAMASAGPARAGGLFNPQDGLLDLGLLLVLVPLMVIHFISQNRRNRGGGHA